MINRLNNTTVSIETKGFAPLTTSQICGGFAILVSVVGLVPYALFIWLVFTKKRLQKSFFKLAGALGFADCIFLVLMIGYAGPCIILQRNLSDSKVLGFFLCLGWFTALPLIICLSLDRYYCICKNESYVKLYSPRSTTIYCIIGWLFGLLYSIPTLFNCCPMYFYYKAMSWSWDVSQDGTKILSYGELVMVVTTLVVTYTLNGLVFRKIHQIQKSITSLGALHNSQKRMREKKIFIQFFITTIWLIIIDIPFIAIGYVSNPSYWFGYFVTMVYTINCSINGWVYMFMNCVIKKEFKSWFRSSRSRSHTMTQDSSERAERADTMVQLKPTTTMYT